MKKGICLVSSICALLILFCGCEVPDSLNPENRLRANEAARKEIFGDIDSVSSSEEISYEVREKIGESLEKVFDGFDCEIYAASIDGKLDLALSMTGEMSKSMFVDFVVGFTNASLEIIKEYELPLYRITVTFTVGKNKDIISWFSDNGVSGTLADFIDGDTVLLEMSPKDLTDRYGSAQIVFN